MFVEGVVCGAHVLAEGEEDDPLAVRRRVREPVVELVTGQLLLPRAVRPHPPELHEPRTRRVEVDVTPVRRILRPVVQRLRVGQTHLLAAVNTDPVDVELAAAPARVDEEAAVGRPAVQVRGRARGDAPRRAAGRGQDVDDGAAFVLARVVADAEPPAVEREDVVVVVRRGEARVDFRHGLRAQVEAVEAAVPVVDERAPVARPVRRLQGVGDGVDDPAPPRRHVEDFEAAPDVVAVLDEARGRRDSDAHAVEEGALGYVLIVRADEEADVDLLAEREALDAPRRERLAEARGRHDERVALSF